jgi:hypothetical protein
MEIHSVGFEKVSNFHSAWFGRVDRFFDITFPRVYQTPKPRSMCL